MYLFADACLRCQAENRQEECVGMYGHCDFDIFCDIESNVPLDIYDI